MSAKIERYDTRKLTDTDRERMAELVRELGLTPGDISARFAVSTDSIGTRLHLTEHLRDECGMKYADLAADQIASVPRVFDIDPARLPVAARPAVPAAAGGPESNEGDQTA